MVVVAETRKVPYNAYCKFCEAEGKKKVKATRMTKYAGPKGRDHKKHYACADHVHLMEDTDPNRTKGENLRAIADYCKNGRDPYMTEADYQTWGRL